MLCPWTENNKCESFNPLLKFKKPFSQDAKELGKMEAGMT